MDPSDEPLLEFDSLINRLGSVLVPVAGLSLLGAVVDGAVRGLTFALLGRWLGLFVAVSVLGIAVMTAVHALTGADRAGKRGERLASPDVGLAPRKVGDTTLLNVLQQANDDGDAADASDDETGHAPRE